MSATHAMVFNVISDTEYLTKEVFGLYYETDNAV